GPLAALPRFRSALAAQEGPVPAWLARGPERRAGIRTWDPAARSVLVCLFPYWNSSLDKDFASLQPEDPETFLRDAGRKKINVPLLERLKSSGAKPMISRYALSRDYHSSIREALEAVLSRAAGVFPGLEGKVFCDTSQVMEKPLAAAAGLGWQGRNTLLLNSRLGSWFFIGGFTLNLDFAADVQPEYPGCGSCRECEKACPSGALSGGRLEISRCLSWHNTMETAGGPFPGERSGWAYGCDDCQKKCPFNEGASGTVPEFLRPLRS
ncbi:MAG: electron transport protein, partial [Elusimicrobia bacterium]